MHRISVLICFVLSQLNPFAIGCSFEGMLASCPMVLGGHHVQVSARINHCHVPIDVSFLVLATNDREPSAHNTDETLRHRPLYWQYTYVTSNNPESREMPNYGQRVLLHVVADTRVERGGTAKWLKLKAQFLVDGHTDSSLTFIDDEVRIPHFDDCQYAHEEDRVGTIAMGCIVTIIILCVIGLGGLWLFKPRKSQDDDQVDLVNNMERPQNTQPRQIMHSADAPTSSSVHYVVPRPDDQGNEDELSVYISTSNGLKKLQRKNSQNSNGSSTGSDPSSSTCHNEDERSPSNMSSSSNDSPSLPNAATASSTVNRSLGAIPKRKPPPLSESSSPTISSSSSTSISR